MTTRKTIAGIAASLLVFSGVAACSAQDQPATPAAPPAAPPATTEPQATEKATTQAQATPVQGARDARANNAGAIQALATAADAASGTPYEIDDSDDHQAWEVDVMAGERTHKVKVSKDGRNVVGQEEEDADAEDVRRLQSASLSLGQALERALKEVPGVLDDAELDDDKDLAVWKVEIDSPDQEGVEVLINVADGQVVRVDR